MNKFRHYRDAEAGTDFRDEAPLTAKHLADESRSLLWHAAFFSSSAGLPYGWIPGKDAAWPHFEKGEFVVPASTLFRLRNGVVVRVDGLKRIQATGDDRVWLVVDYADPAQATPDCERSRFNLKLTKDSPPDDCDVGDWYTEVVPLRLASIGGFNGPVGAQLRDLDTKIKTLVNQLIVGQFAIRMGAAAALAYAQLRLENLGLTLLDLKNELERAYVWMKFEKPGLPKLPDFSDDEPSTGNILNKFVGTVEEWRSNLAIESAWKATTLEDFYTIVASTKHVLYEKGQWTLAEGQNPAKTWNVSNIGAQSDLFLAVSDRQFSLEVTYDMDGKTVRPPHTRNFNQIERFHVLKGDRGFFAGVGDSFKITTDKRVVLLIPAG